MARPAWQVEVPDTYLTPDERRELEEKQSTPRDPLEGLTELEEIAEQFDVEVLIRIRGLYMMGVRITVNLAHQVHEQLYNKGDTE